jgi:hypothetical protein
MEPVNAEPLKFFQEVVDVIITYGIPALGLVLIVIVPPITIRWAKSRSIGYASGSAGLAFLITYGVFSIVAQYFPWLLSKSVLSGMVWEVPDGFKVEVRDNERRVGYGYLKRENHPNDPRLFNEYFLLYPVRDPRCLAIIIDSTDPNKEQESIYNVEGLEKSDVTSRKDLILHAKRTPQGDIKLNGWREQDGQHVPPPLNVDKQTSAEHLCGDDNEDQPAKHSDLFGNIFAVAHAAGKSPQPANPGPRPAETNPRPPLKTLENIKAALQNDDAFVRRDARSNLAKLGPNAAPILSELLSSGNYRLELGSLAAIAEMTKEQRAGLRMKSKDGSRATPIALIKLCVRPRAAL